MNRTIFVTESSVRLEGQWQVLSDGVRHSQITEHLNDFLELAWSGVALSAQLSSVTGRRIAVVVKLDGQPIPNDLAGSSVLFGEGQSYVIVEGETEAHLVNAAPDVAHTLQLLTRSDKLVCHHFKTNRSFT